MYVIFTYFFQQLSSSDQPIVGEQVQALQQMNASLQRQLEQAVQTASSERDEFQLYVQQLNAQMTSLTSQVNIQNLYAQNHNFKM